MIAHQVGLPLGELADAQPTASTWSGDWTRGAIERIAGLVPDVANAAGTSRARWLRPAAYLYARDFTLLPSECEAVARARLGLDRYHPNNVDTSDPELLYRVRIGPGIDDEAHLWSRCTGEKTRMGGESGRELHRRLQAQGWGRWMLEAKSLNSTRVDVIEKTMASLYRASRVLCDRLLPASAPAAEVSETWKRYIPAPTLEFLLLTAALALSPASDRQALTFALDLVEQAEPLTDGWAIGLDLAMSRGVAGAERLAVLTASRHGDPLWGALAWAWRIRGMRRATMAELLIAFGLLDVEGRQAFEFAAPAEPTDDPKHLAIFAVDPERSVPEVRSFYR